MTDCPNLTSMGILHPEQITNFQVNSFANYDVLRVLYKREKGSLLPDSRTYKFLRVQKDAVVNRESGQTETVLETNPCLKSALGELRSLRDALEKKQDVAASVREELERLEQDVALRAAGIRELIGHL